MENKDMKVGWIGLGQMGVPMADHLLTNGHKCLVYNRTKSKAEQHIAKGAVFAEPKEIVETCNIIFIMLNTPKNLEDLIYNDSAIINHLKPGTIVIDHSTNSLELTNRIYKDLKEKNVSFLDIPVSGAEIAAKNGQLTVLAGGDKESYEKVLPLLKCYAVNQNYFGNSGLGQQAKKCAQICLASTLVGVVETMLFAHKAGLDREQIFNTLKDSAVGSAIVKVYMSKIVNDDFESGAKVSMLIKDIELVLSDCKKYNLVLPFLSQIKVFYDAVVANGGADKGFPSLLLVLEQMNGIKREK